MSKRQTLTVLIAILATGLFIIPGLAFGRGGGNGTPNPPPTNPPCDADGHDGQPPPYAGPRKNSGSCKGDSTGTTSTGTSSTSTSSSSSSTSTSSSSSSTSTSTTTTTTTATTSTTGDVCETDGVLGSKGLGLNSPDDRTIGQIVWDELGLVVQDPQIPGGGPLSQPLYDGLIGIPLGGLETPIAAEVGCLLNNLSL
jgi:hypothetical protein